MLAGDQIVCVIYKRKDLEEKDAWLKEFNGRTSLGIIVRRVIVLVKTLS